MGVVVWDPIPVFLVWEMEEIDGNRGMLETKGENGQGQGFQRSIAMAQDLQAALLRLGTCGT
jgi:hypothetical protein